MPKKPTFQDQFEQIRPSLDRYAQAILKDAQHLAEGAVSETAEKGWAKYSSFDEKKGTFQAWIYRILKNTCISELRKLKNRVEPKEGEDIEGVMDEAKAVVLMDYMNQINLHTIAVNGSTPGLVPGKFLRIIVGPRPPG